LWYHDYLESVCVCECMGLEERSVEGLCMMMASPEEIEQEPLHQLIATIQGLAPAAAAPGVVYDDG